MRCVDFHLAGGVMACGGLAADSRLLDGYRAAASAMILLLNGCRYFAPERGEAAVVFSNAGFHERFVALASLLYQTQDQVDVLRMVAGLMPSIRSMGNQYEWGKIVGAPVDIGRSWSGIDDLLGIKPRTF
ncbi:hypothetical protein [Magnetospirillum sp. SS-4]|uniref:hypothetical protein n=1 Tax=Magnetospirillum sp. SS-4 TaxID=2681465 RepID=UPI00137C52FE|nr:hypothetical protein [Magnetospirillum sp. SS-4]CAA7615484.1 hypothetical protein MTBSS4_130024 [Magnetospirillum sp. SS-4]